MNSKQLATYLNTSWKTSKKEYNVYKYDGFKPLQNIFDTLLIAEHSRGSRCIKNAYSTKRVSGQKYKLKRFHTIFIQGLSEVLI